MDIPRLILLFFMQVIGKQENTILQLKMRGMMGLVLSGGAVVGPVLLGYLFDNGFVARVIGKEWIFPEGEYTLGIFILLIVTIMATVCFWFAGPPKHKPDVFVKAEI